LEWCSDWYEPHYYAESPSEDPQGPLKASHRVFRGGGWLNTPLNCRSAERIGNSPAYRFNCLGFRVACPWSVVSCVRLAPRTDN